MKYIIPCKRQTPGSGNIIFLTAAHPGKARDLYAETAKIA